jgi:hypothetical protein
MQVRAKASVELALKSARIRGLLPWFSVLGES